MNKIFFLLALLFSTPLFAVNEKVTGATADSGFVLCKATAALELGSARGANHAITIVNTSSSNAYIGLASVTAGGGLVMRQNDAITIDWFKGPVFCITDSGNTAGLRWFQEINAR